MFAALDQYSKGLQDKEEKEKFQMEESLIELQGESENLTEELQLLQETKDRLVADYEELKERREIQQRIIFERKKQKKLKQQKQK